MEWYALFVETGKEEEVQKWLNFSFNEGTLHTLVPKRKLNEKRNGKWQSIIKKLFPSYVFIKTNIDLNIYKKIRDLPHVIRILNTDSYYTQIDQKEMSILLRLIGENSLIDCSKVLLENSKIIVKEGPLFGLEGIIKKIDKHKSRARVQLNLIGDLRMVDLGIELLYKLD